jgi:hypothetical protein
MVQGLYPIQEITLQVVQRLYLITLRQGGLAQHTLYVMVEVGLTDTPQQVVLIIVHQLERVEELRVKGVVEVE